MALALVASVAALLLWLANPFAALLAVPAAHLWMLVLVAARPADRRVRALLVALGALPALLVARLLPDRALDRTRSAAPGTCCCS